MRIIVTGAAGFLGSHLCDKLLSDGHYVIGIDNFFRGKQENLPNHPNFEFKKIDLSSSTFSTTDVDIIFHYAAINGTRYFYDIPYKVIDDNIRMTQNVLSSVGSSVKKIIYASSSEIYGDSPIIPTDENQHIDLNIYADRDSYASSKAIGEFMVKMFCNQLNIPYIIVRPFNTYGTRMTTNGYGQVIPELIERLNDDDFYIYGSGKQTRSFCYVTDHVNIVTRLLDYANNEVLNIGYDEEISILDLALTIMNVYGVNKEINFKKGWDNDTKWRRPSLVNLRKYINDYQFIKLTEGINIIKNGN